ncbi:cytochrome P450 family protein [Deinococcus roseus]|uniref:Polyketide biosynthesis cytochrome P450 PksS n=1 Tax=Deinococcus roseus TaxID=392414 RepID=A0ABQ2D3Q6_9DEIO|nr:cytochrome P450 [Deinococcus roseus]GGJ40954.1 polyketide biosynthesis cytochrome P450 PksS [Deinococcus roseus]
MGKISIVSRQFKADPFPFYANLRAESPIYPTQVGSRKVWLVSRYDDVVSLLKDERFVKDRRNIEGSKQKEQWVPAILKPLMRNMLDQDEPDHRRLKTLVHQAFTPRRIEHMRGRIQEITHILLNHLEKKREAELIHDFALPLPMTVITEILGIPAADHGKFHHWTRAILKAPTELNALLSLPQMVALMKYLRTLVQSRRDQPRDDLVTAIVQAEEAGDHLSEDECLAMIFLLITAGHETTVNLITNGVLTLLQHPAEKNRLLNDFSLIPSATEELARFSPPVEMATERYARSDLTLLGAGIKAGEMVLGVIASANRDESQFKKADVLDLGRNPNKHLSFGQGMHYCLGAPLARMELHIAFRMLLERFPDLVLKARPEQLRWRPTFVIRGLERLPVRV